MKRLYIRFAMFFAVVGVLASLSALAFATIASAEWIDNGDGEPTAGRRYSHRLIVELQTPPLALKLAELPEARSADGSLNLRSAAASSYIQALQAEQAALMADVRNVLPDARVSTYINEYGAHIEQAYQVVVNAVVVDPGVSARSGAIEALRKLPNVKAVYRDYANDPHLYTSTHLVNADAVWATLGGQADAGRGIKLASVDGGVHHEAPMFSGEGFDYPPGYPVGGLGLTANNNGKIIVSRAYFRSWDPPAPGDENPWPGVAGTSHGVHTAGIAAGNIVTDATFYGAPIPPLSGVAPGAWIGSYRVFYYSVNGDGSFYDAEGLAALEDVVKDGMDVVNNSWGGGPGSIGGEFDMIDTALRNVVAAGIFVSMSNGNAGPNPTTGDHPSTDYINVAATTSGGTYSAGRFDVTGPGEVVSDTIQNIPFQVAGFGGAIPAAQIISHTYIASANIDGGSNLEGCDAWPADTFEGKGALIQRGTCEFGVKVVNAEEAGATFVVVYNNAAGGEELINMGPGVVGDQATIPAIFIGYAAGSDMAAWQAQHPDDAEFTLNTVGYQAGNEPDYLANFSSRGPSTRNSLKPDIAAPGVDIMSQGYTPGAEGEARHLGFGQVSGTSMASPHVAGAAALLLQANPTWTPAEIKSALMSTSKYTEVYNADGSPAQPIDMGAGRLDIAAAMDPGVILSPPAADLGLVVTGTAESVTFQVRNITDAAETYTLSTLYTGDGFTQTTSLQGVSVNPTELSLEPGEVATVTVEFDPAAGMGYDFNQGYIVLDGEEHDAHLPFFARVVEGLGTSPVLVIDTDLSGLVFPNDYARYYTSTLENLGIPYDYWDTSDLIFEADLARTIADFGSLAKYQAIIVFSGDNFYPNGSFSVKTPLTAVDMELLNAYVQSGGTLVVMGQDFASVAGATNPSSAPFLYAATLGAEYLQDSVTGEELPALPVVPKADAPPAFEDIFLDLSGPNRGLGQVQLLGANEAPTPVDNAGIITGVAAFSFDNFTDRLAYSIRIDVAQPFTLTVAHIHSGTVGVSGPPIHFTWPFTEPQVVTDTIVWGGSVILTPEEQALREAGGLYLNVHSTDNPSGEIRGQLPSFAVAGDGAGNQYYIDEITYSTPDDVPDPTPSFWTVGLLTYPGPNNVEDGTVAVANRDQPTLERPGISFLGKTLYTTFGLEGVNNGVGSTTREALVSKITKWAMDNPTVTISHTGEITTSNASQFAILYSSAITDSTPVSFRWDWGDDSPYSAEMPIVPAVMHQYAECGEYTVRVEVTNSYGNKAIGERTVTVTACPPEVEYEYFHYLPNISNTSEE